jgi:hypothetical protein
LIQIKGDDWCDLAQREAIENGHRKGIVEQKASDQRTIRPTRNMVVYILVLDVHGGKK